MFIKKYQIALDKDEIVKMYSNKLIEIVATHSRDFSHELVASA